MVYPCPRIMKLPYRIQEKFPNSYALLRRLYRRSWLYRREVAKNLRVRKAQEERGAARRARDQQVISQVFKGAYVVHGGPFENMKYLEQATGSQLFPKILGSYEEPLHCWIEDAIRREYDAIIDVGCAEGYYAVGMALKSPRSVIYAYDTDEAARAMCNDLARLNGVAERVNLYPECTYDELQRCISSRTLIICDIEGYELALLKPERAPALLHADMIVESHDSLYGYGNITEELIKRFCKSHKIEIILDYPRSTDDYPILEACDDSFRRDLVDERRGTVMKWLRLTHLEERS